MSKNKKDKAVIVEEIALMDHNLSLLKIPHAKPLTEKANRKDLKVQHEDFNRLLDEATEPNDELKAKVKEAVASPPLNSKETVAEVQCYASTSSPGASKGNVFMEEDDDLGQIDDTDDSPHNKNNLLNDVLLDVADELNGRREEKLNGASCPEDTFRNNEIVHVPRLKYSLTRDAIIRQQCEESGVNLQEIPSNQEEARMLHFQNPQKLTEMLSSLEKLAAELLDLPCIDESYKLAKDLQAARRENRLENILKLFDEDDQEFARELSSYSPQQLHQAVRKIIDQLKHSQVLAVRKKEQARVEEERTEKKRPSSVEAHCLDDYEKRTDADARVAAVQKKLNEQLEQVRKELQQARAEVPPQIRKVWDAVMPPLRVVATNFFPKKLELQKDDHLFEVVQELVESHKRSVQLQEEMTSQANTLRTITDQRNAALIQREKIAKSRVSPRWKQGCWLLIVVTILVSSYVLGMSSLKKSSTTESKSINIQQKAAEKQLDVKKETPVRQGASDQVNQSKPDEDASLQELKSLLQRIED